MRTTRGGAVDAHFGALRLTFSYPAVDGTLLVHAPGGELVHAVEIDVVGVVDPEGAPV